MNDINWTPLETVTQLASIDELSQSVPCLIFKHSTRCPVSSLAENRLNKKWEFSQETVAPYYLDLIAYREVSNAVADAYGVTHESPQVLLIKDGRCVYAASHLEIDVDAISENLNATA